MWEVKVIDRERKIIGLKWSGYVKKEEVAEANKRLEEVFNELNADSFDMIVEMENILAFPKETQQEIVEQQKWVISKGLKRAAVVVEKATTRAHLRQTAQQSHHTNEFHFSSFDEALAFLKGES